ncbi:MAG TPA: class I adenylate-forming enzyme family protein [Thermoanaerobaculia bacterium]|nr:class I adenylate-forming enzyme family protein [Thermoanaerobaculia bacterium]
MTIESIYTTFVALAEEDPGAPALIDGSSFLSTSRRQLLDRADELASTLSSRGVAEGTVVAIQLPNSVDFVAAILATLRLHSVALPIDRDSRSSEVAQVIDRLGVKAVIRGSPREVTSVQPAASRRAAEGTAVLKLTSGSTGDPRAIITPESCLIADCRNITSTMLIRADDRNLGAIPFSHSYGFSNLVTPLLLQGTSIVISNDYVPISLIELSNRFSCTVLPGIPLMFDLLSQTLASDGQFETVRTFISAGAPLTARVSHRFRERFGKEIHTFYGCSETGGITYDRAGAAAERNEVGSAMDGVELSTDVESGRMVVRSDAVARGYFGGTPGEEERFSSAGFITDDIASLHSDGSVQLVGRVGGQINTAGKKVNPREVEAVLMQLDGVRDAKVYGEPAGARGEVVAAAVVADPAITREQIRGHCRQKLSSHKVPRIIKLIDSIPRDERGKVRKAALTELDSIR